MATPTTSIELKGIASVLKTSRLRVPTHQRPFEWTEYEVQTFLDDISGALDAELDEYFLGSIVVIRSPQPHWLEVLDGQQRLATVSLLLAGVADEFDRRGELQRSMAVHQYFSSFDIPTNATQPHLRLNEQDDNYFQTLLDKHYPAPNPNAPESHRFEGRNPALYFLVRNSDFIDPL
jgi:uncharacterized protein with ParB-like and HNH nuclease domain